MIAFEAKPRSSNFPFCDRFLQPRDHVHLLDDDPPSPHDEIGIWGNEFCGRGLAFARPRTSRVRVHIGAPKRVE